MVYNYFRRNRQQIPAQQSSKFGIFAHHFKDLLDHVSGICAFCQQTTNASGDIDDESPINAHGICQTCYQIIIRQGFYCQQCGFELKNEQPLCGYCIKKPPIYQRLISACDYKPPVNQAISRIKYQRQLALLRGLTFALKQQISTAYAKNDWQMPQAIIPIPLHRLRWFERGFNQSQLIAKQLSQDFSLSLQANTLIRSKNTPHQTELKATERRRNLKNAFQISTKAELPKHIALIDDVVTTRSTITAASKVLQKHGVQQIDVWCLAKT